MIRATLATAAVLIVGLAAPAYADVIQGTDENDHFGGTRRADVMLGFAGDDHINGRRGDDDIRGGDGDDLLWPGVNDGEGRNY